MMYKRMIAGLSDIAFKRDTTYTRMIIWIATIAIFVCLGVAAYGFVIGNNIIVVHCFTQSIFLGLWVFFASWAGYDE